MVGVPPPDAEGPSLHLWALSSSCLVGHPWALLVLLGADGSLLAPPPALIRHFAPCWGEAPGAKGSSSSHIWEPPASSELQVLRAPPKTFILTRSSETGVWAGLGPLTPMSSAGLWPFLGLQSGCVLPEVKDSSLGLRGPDHPDWALSATPTPPAAVLGADVPLHRWVCVVRARSGGWRRAGRDDPGQTLQLAEAPAKTVPAPPPPLHSLSTWGLCANSSWSLLSASPPPFPPAPSLLPNASQLALPSQALPVPQVI